MIRLKNPLHAPSSLAINEDCSWFMCVTCCSENTLDCWVKTWCQRIINQMQRFQFSFMSVTLFKVIASKPVEWPCGCWRCLFNFKRTCCIPFEQLIDDQTKVSMLERQNKKSLYIIRSRAFIRATHSLRGFLYNSLSAILGKKRDLKSPSNLLCGREYEVQGKTNLTINLN